jgi:transposase InsO family protein
MSRKGNCWDNAPTESFWGRLKTASVHGHKFTTREQAKQAVMDWMAFYNHRRLHSSLGYLSPMQFEPRRPPKVLHLWPPKLLHPGRGDLAH